MKIRTNFLKSFLLMCVCFAMLSQQVLGQASQNDFSNTLELISNHITGSATLSNAQISSAQDALEDDITVLQNNLTAIVDAFELVELFEATEGPLFVNGSTTEGGFQRNGTGLELERFMFYLQQSILDYSYTEENLLDYPLVFEDFKFETSSYFPGAVNPPADSDTNRTVRINGNHIRNSGAPANYENFDARRPTGSYLAPGSVATVTVPASMVNTGASILVGAHTWDNETKPRHRRLDRVTKLYPITSQTVTVANPLGGGIYINIPFESRLGIVNVEIRNTVRSPYFANTVANQTTAAEWRNVERNHPAPWADFETDKVMHQVPTSWIYNVDDPTSAMDDWDESMDAISEMLGRPLIRSKSVVYQQVDLQFRGSAFFPGYPQANIVYDPNIDYGGNHDHFLVNGPRDGTQNQLSTFFHELGHGEKIFKFNGEIEAMVQFLYVAVYNKKFGVDLDTALARSSTTVNTHTIDEAAISWMISENFRLGNPMSTTTGQFRQEFSYQPRGYAKYADIVKLFGWDAIEQFYRTLNADYDAGTYESANINVNNVPTDSRTLRMSIAAGYDLRPLLHFWGKHPDNFNALADSIERSGVQQSAAIYDRLEYYQTIVPTTNDGFKEFATLNYSESSILNFANEFIANISQSFYEGFLNKFYDSYMRTEGVAAIEEIHNILDLYFPNGRPDDQIITPIPSPPTGNGFTPDPSKTYYIENPTHGYRIAATGDSQAPYTESITTTGPNVEWRFTQHPSGNWHIDRAAGGDLIRLRTDNDSTPDMDPTSSAGIWTYYQITPSTAVNGTYYLTLPSGPASFQRLRVLSDGSMDFNTVSNQGVNPSLRFVEVDGGVVHIRKRNAQGFALDGDNGAENGQSVYLWSQNSNNVNQQWIEINRGEGFYSYQKQGTNHCIDGGNGGAKGQDVYLWECSDNNQNQHWLKFDAGSGFVQLRKRNAQDFAIDGRNGGAAGQNVQLFDSSSTSQNLQWSIEPVQ